MRRNTTPKTTLERAIESTLKSLAITGSIVLVLLVALLASPSVGPAQAHPSSFPDVAEAHPAHEAIEALVSQGVVGGFTNGDFRPEALVTRAQAMKILVAWQGAATDGPASSFPDVDDIYDPYVDAAFAAGWIGGYPDGTFQPGSPLSRQQAVTVICRSLGLQKTASALSARDMNSSLARFKDRAVVSAAARPYVALALDRGLLLGDGDRLLPTLAITRAQFALLVHRAGRNIGYGAGQKDAVTGTAATADGTAPAADESVAAVDESALAAFMDARLFRPHSSPVTGAMVLQNTDWYGIPPLAQLVIMAAETSLGDPQLGGALARSNNFGCLRYHGADSPWGELSDGRIWVTGNDWYSFPSAELGMAAFGRYLKSGVNGFYLPLLTADGPRWEEFAGVYYGRGVSGFDTYVARLHTLEARFRQMAAEYGVSF